MTTAEQQAAAPPIPRWRQGYDAIESMIGSQLEQLVRSDRFAQAAGVIVQVQRELEQRGSRLSRQVLHRLNLPAGSDVSRLLTEIGDLKTQVRQLTAQLEAAGTLSRGRDQGGSRGRSRR